MFVGRSFSSGSICVFTHKYDFTCSLGCISRGDSEDCLAVFCELGCPECFGEDACRVVHGVGLVESEDSVG